jgi:hypothetical protein
MKALKSLVLTLLMVVSGICPALSATEAGYEGLGDGQGPVDNLSSVRYRLATLPSINRKKVDAMCLRFLSLIPKAMLIPRSRERTVYRLVTDNYDTLEAAKRRKAELSHYSEEPFILKENASYYVVVGSFSTEESAQVEQRRLADKRITTSVVERTLFLKHWQMKSTESYSIRDAVIMASKLSKAGVTTVLEPVENR